MPERYQILYRGERLEGVSEMQLRRGLAQLFKADDVLLDKLLSGRPQLLKRDCDRETASRYREAMARVGAVAILQPMQPQAVHTGASAELSLTEAGTPVLRPEERGKPAEPSVRIPELDVAAAGTRLTDAPEPAPPPPDTSQLSVVDAGENIPTLPGPPPAEIPDSGLSLTPEGTDFSDCRAPEAGAPQLDLSALSLAPEGEPVLTEAQRRTQAPPAPDTTHLSLAPEPPEA